MKLWLAIKLRDCAFRLLGFKCIGGAGGEGYIAFYGVTRNIEFMELEADEFLAYVRKSRKRAADFVTPASSRQ